MLFVQKLRDMVVEELQDACLEVELSHAGAEVQWLKQGVLLQPGAKYQLQEAGRRRALTIHSLSPSDRGTYRCETLHDRTQAKLSVEREYLPAAWALACRLPSWHMPRASWGEAEVAQGVEGRGGCRQGAEGMGMGMAWGAGW